MPVIDLNEMTLAKPAARRLSTRIILVNYPFEAQHLRPLGLIAEQATNMIQLSLQDFIPSGVESNEARYLAEWLRTLEV